MRSFAALILIFGALIIATPVMANEQKPADIAEKVSFKFVRGVTNVFTSIAEIPKQTMITARNHGNVGYVVGPVKGIGMFLYRGLIGFTETVFCLVPQPGYYEPMMDPEFVWHDWKDTKDPGMQEAQPQSAGKAN